MKIGVIGRGIVGGATGKAFEPHVDEVRYWDKLHDRRTHQYAQVLQCDLVFVCLPTPQKQESLECDLGYIHDYFGELLGPKIPYWQQVNFVLRSTVPVGTTRMLREKYGLTNLVHSPEFLTARTAEEDAKNPIRTIIGHPFRPGGPNDLGCCGKLLRDLYVEVFPTAHLYHLTSDESEFVKLMQNSFSAIKIAAFNEFRCFSDAKGMDWERCLAALLAGGWINPQHTSVPGPDGLRGFGGSCLPKDLANMIHCMEDAGINPDAVCYAAYKRNKEDRK